MTKPIGIPAERERVQPVASEFLQPLLADLTALALNGKQAHWHVTGPQFLPVHEQLDALVSDVRSWTDMVAERAITLGVPVDGRPETVAATTKVQSVAEGWLPADKAVAAMVDELRGVIERTRAGLDRLGELDLVTQDLVVEILRGLEKHLWMFQAQLT
ncbi:MAG: DNA starvation/stationary phase protection protein [Acidimicrobiia bacterium]